MVFTARCYAERGIATASRLSVRLSVRDVEVSLSHRLEYFEDNLTVISLGCFALRRLNITDLLQGEHPEFRPEQGWGTEKAVTIEVQ